MFIQQNTTPDFGFKVDSGTLDSYKVLKAGSTTPASGTGTITPITGAMSKILLASGETDTLGDLTIILLDNTNTFLGLVSHQVVSFNPNGPNYGSGSDPLLSAVPGSYGAGTAGNVLGNLIANLLGTTVESGAVSTTFVDLLKLLNAYISGRTNGMGTNTIHFRDPNNAKNRLTATMDASGNRLSITRDLT